MGGRSTGTKKWSPRVIVRYSLFQIPAIVLLIMVLILVQQWIVNIPAWIFWGLIAIWIAKDVMLFPFVWRAYDDRSVDASLIVGAQGIAQERIAPTGYVLVQSELWRAEVMGNSLPIEKGEPVVVQKVSGLTILVCSKKTDANL